MGGEPRWPVVQTGEQLAEARRAAVVPAGLARAVQVRAVQVRAGRALVVRVPRLDAAGVRRSRTGVRAAPTPLRRAGGQDRARGPRSAVAPQEPLGDLLREAVPRAAADGQRQGA